EGSGIDQHSGRRIRTILNVERRLVLQPAVLEEEEPLAAAEGRANLGVTPCSRNQIANLAARRHASEKGFGQRVLRSDPVPDFGCGEILEPPKGVGYAHATQVVRLSASRG